MNNPAIKRLAKELQEIQHFNSEDDDNFIQAAPLKDDLFEWHFTLKGPQNSDYSEGFYHGRILFPSNYPFTPPSISFFTPNGRWEVDKKICLSVTGFHPEMWQPAWGIRTILLAMRDHFTTDDKAAIGYLDYPSESRKQLAQKSRCWKCKLCPYDAAKFLSSEESDGCAQQNSFSCADKQDSCNSENNRLFIIGFILLLLSVMLSYAYLYII